MTAGQRCFSDGELAALSRTPREEFEASLATGPTVAGDVAASIARSYRDQLGGSRAWIAAVLGYIGERHGPDGLVEASGATSRLFHALAACGALRPGGQPAEQVAEDTGALVTAVSSGDHRSAVAAFDAVGLPTLSVFALSP